MAHTPKLSVSDTLKQPMRDGHKQPLKEKKDRTRAKGDDVCEEKEGVVLNGKYLHNLPRLVPRVGLGPNFGSTPLSSLVHSCCCRCSNCPITMVAQDAREILREGR